MLAVCELAVAAPLVKKIDPPNWWVGLPNPMLLISGDELGGASVQAQGGVGVSRTQSDAAGHYLFVWLDTSRASPGTVQLKLETAKGAATISFPVRARDSARTGFQGFGQDDVIYLIMPDRFADGDRSNDRPAGSTATYDRSQPKAYHGGDLQGIRNHLDYLHELGVNTLWLTPVWKNADSDYHGYHVVDFYAIDEHMGSLRDYQELIDGAHQLKMKVLIDYVANHTGPDHPWVNDPPTSRWFHGTPGNHLQPLYEFGSLIDPHATAAEKQRTIEGWFVDRLPDLNTDDALVSQYLLDNALWWTEIAGLDGFRLDTFPYSTRRFWSSFLQGLYAVYPRVDSVGEVSDHDPAVSAFFDGGRSQFDGIDSQVSTVFDFPLSYALRDVILKGEPVGRIIEVLQRDWLYPNPDMLVTFLGNHDNRRFRSEEGSSAEKLKLAFSLLLTLRGIPQIYSGDEIGMQGGEDPDNRRDFPGGFPGDLQNAFVTAGRTVEQEEVFSHVQALLRVRSQHTALRRGHQWHLGWDKNYYAFVRESAEEKVAVVFNNGGSPLDVTLKLERTPLQDIREVEKLFGPGRAELKEGALHVVSPGTSLSMYRVR